jgi:hypothetical protein
VDDYGRELATIAHQLQVAAMTCSIRGEGAARFVFVERGARAAELSRGGGGWWVEFWLGEAVAAEHTYPSAEVATQAACAWLATHLA